MTRLTDAQVGTAVRMGLAANPLTVSLNIDVDVFDHRVFLRGQVRDLVDVKHVEQSVACIRDVGEVVDLMEVDQVVS